MADAFSILTDPEQSLVSASQLKPRSITDLIADYVAAPAAGLILRVCLAVPLLRRWLFGTTPDGANLKLPPVVLPSLLLSAFRHHGIWAHHKHDQDFVQKHGHIYCVIPPRTGFEAPVLMVNISDPELVRQVIMDTKTFPSRGRSGMSSTVKNGLVELPTGPRHAFHRRIIGSLLTDNHLQKYAPIVQAETAVMLSKWADATGPVNAHYDATMLTEDIIGVIGLGQHLNQQQIPQTMNKAAADRAFMMKRSAIHTAVGRRISQMFSSAKDNARENRIRANGKNVADKKIAKALDAARAAECESANMISALFHAVDTKSGTKLSVQEVIDEFITIRGAGHETTSNTLSWALMLLAQNPDKQQKLLAEVRAVVAGPTATFQDTLKLRYCKMCVYEALRLFPTVPSFPRLSVRHCTLGGYDIPANSLVFVSQCPMNTRKDLWGEDAEQFRPGRFDHPGYNLELTQAMPKGVCPVDTAGKPGPLFGFLPFGAGKRTCPGQRLALIESVIILASVVKHFHLQMHRPGAGAVVEQSDITLGPKKGLWLKVSLRDDPATTAAASAGFGATSFRPRSKL